MNEADQCQRCGRYLYGRAEAAAEKLIESLRAQLAESESERLEQARLLGMSGSREAALRAQLAEAKEAARTWENEAERRSRRYEVCAVQVAAMREALSALVDCAEHWFNTTDRRGMSVNDYKTWHALGYGSNAYRSAKKALASQPAQHTGKE